MAKSEIGWITGDGGVILELLRCMSEFVNYKKRSVALPPGCKNLIDVLRLREARDIQSITSSGATRRSGANTGKLSELRKYAEMLFGSRAQMFMLAISTPDMHFTVDILQTKDGSIRGHMYVQQETAQEEALRNFFAVRGMKLPDDENIPDEFLPGGQVYQRYDLSPVPPEAALFAKLVAEIFGDVFGLSDDSPLHFCYDEIG